MFTFGKRAAAFIAASALALSGLAGCGGGPAEPTNAQELLERFEQAENHDNFHAVLDYDVEMNVLGQSIPITIKMDMDCAGEAAHGDLTMSGMGQEMASELYVEKDGDTYMQYSSTGEGDDVTWAKSEVDSSAIESLTDEELLADAEFAKTDDGYTLTVPGDKLMEAMAASGADMSELFDSLGDDSLKDALADADAVYTFDSDCMLTGFTYDLDFDYDYSADADADADADSTAALTMNMKMSITMTVSDYGSVKAEDVAVPEDVKKSAGEASATIEEINPLAGEYDQETTQEAPAESEDGSLGTVEIGADGEAVEEAA